MSASVAAGAGGVGLLALLLLLGGDPTAQAGAATGAACASTGPVQSLDAAAAQNARIVAAVAQARGGPGAVLITEMVGLTESGLHVLANPADPGSLTLPHQGVSSSASSTGIFQQQTWWGTLAQRMDPVASTGLFMDALNKIPNWQTMPPWEAAQAVQASAWTGVPSPLNGNSSVVGGNYQMAAAQASSIAASVGAATTVAALKCGGSGAGKPPGGPTGATGLPVAYTIPAGTTPAATTAINSTLSELGKSYVFGASGPNTFDCSGLMMSAWSAAGVHLHRVTTGQLTDGTATDATHLSPGDLVLIPGGSGTLAAPDHVGMFIGDGLVIHAPHTGDVVRVATLTSFTSGGVSGYRHIG